MDDLKHLQLPELTGSEKQIAWAEGIRDRMAPLFIDWINEGERIVRESDDEKRMERQYVWEHARDWAMSVLLNPSAAWWIDNRDFGPRSLWQFYGLEKGILREREPLVRVNVLKQNGEFLGEAKVRWSAYVDVADRNGHCSVGSLTNADLKMSRPGDNSDIQWLAVWDHEIVRLERLDT